MPTQVQTQTQLGWSYQTSMVNEIKTPSSFLTTLLFGGREEAIPTESMELSYKDGTRDLAPFVEVNGEAVQVGARSTTFATVSLPNIREKRPMDAYNAFIRRQPGTGMFITSGAPVAEARAQAIAEDAAYMVELVENRVEWMVAQMITSMIDGFMRLTYSVRDRANFTISIPRSTEMDNTLTGGALWDGVSPDIEENFHRTKRLFSKHVNGPAGTLVLGTSASNAFRKNAAVKADLDKKNVSAGTLQLVNQFNGEGAIYLGNIYGIDVWEYAREYMSEAAPGVPSVATPFIPANMGVFIAGGTVLQDNKIFYGCIPDHGAFEGGSFVGKRFSKSWTQPDPSVYIQLLQTRPLPIIRRPNGISPWVLTA